MHILLIEDDLDLGKALQAALRQGGFSSRWLRRGADAPERLDPVQQDAVLLDLGLPDGCGLQLLKRWRAQGAATPLLVMTARVGLADRLEGLDGGADDYLSKPFEIPELMARLRALLRRSAGQASENWRIGDLTIRPREREVRVCGRAVELSPREFDLLNLLAGEAGTVVPKGKLAQKLAPLGEALDFANLEMYLSNLRRKIGAERIGTVRGIGYRLLT
ncbi:response regulator transcription factor [Paucibacter sediminis]|uniref:Response regulator transcription factor n=1 Tax=Paucibacter sediminis TaxID=3019553 RepID=A0AA95NET7_9BURK|nr:response regulator transcription factor [Paucibacter sp. S2-9]WIT12955.1 response regulator transcription factor [Paucibacter sp. S2-9]